MKAEDIAHIYRDGRHYDRLFDPPYMPFWLDLAHQLGGPILELGCGTGKLTIPLAEAGFEQFFAPGFGHAAADRQSDSSVLGILHVLGMLTKVVEVCRDHFPHSGAERGRVAIVDQGADDPGYAVGSVA